MVITHALQEWSAVTQALGNGSSICVIRKGGIHEPKGGTFTLPHRHFALLPSYLHQQQSRLVSTIAAGNLTPDPNPELITLRFIATCEHYWHCHDTDAFIHSPECMWTKDEVQARWEFKERGWLAVAALRVRRLVEPLTFARSKEHAGCRSWLPVPNTIEHTAGDVIVPDREWQKRLTDLERTIQRG